MHKTTYDQAKNLPYPTLEMLQKDIRARSPCTLYQSTKFPNSFVRDPRMGSGFMQQTRKKCQKVNQKPREGKTRKSRNRIQKEAYLDQA